MDDLEEGSFDPFRAMLMEIEDVQDGQAPLDHREEIKRTSYLFQGDFSDADNEDDEDAALFERHAKAKEITFIQESIDDLIEKGKRRNLTYQELLQRRETRKKRLMQADEAKSMVLLYFARLISANRVVYGDALLRGLLLSQIPEEYFRKYHSQPAEVKFSQRLDLVIRQFNSMFASRLDDSIVETLDSEDDNLTLRLQREQPLSRLDYLLLFACFLTMHDLIIRMCYPIDITLMEQNKFIKVTRKGGGAKKKPVIDFKDIPADKSMFEESKEDLPDKYQYGVAQRANKKRKYVDSFTEKKLNGRDPQEGDDDREFKRFRHNTQTDQNVETQADSEMVDIKPLSLLEKFAFDPKGKRTLKTPQTSAQPIKEQARVKAQTQELRRVIPESHLFLGNTHAQGEFNSVTKKAPTPAIEKHSPESYDCSKDIQLTFSENLFLEVFDPDQLRWVIACPLTSRAIPSTHADVKKHFRNEGTLYVLSSQKYSRTSDYSFIRETGALYQNERAIKSYLKAKNSCLLTRSVEDYITLFGQYIPNFADEVTSLLIKREAQEIERLEMRWVPETLNEFKNSKYYTLVSTIKKYQGLLPSAKPLSDHTFKGEQIFLRRDITELHTQERWKKHQRQVRKGEEPYKKVKGLYNDPERLAELYGYWQTVPFRIKLTEEGKIPANQYGNIEVFNGPLPEGTVHVDIAKAALICKKLNLDHVPAVVGFEKGPNGRSHPCIQGVVTFKENRQRIMDEVRKFEMEARAREQERVEKRAKQVWRQLIRSILVKKYVQEVYNRDEVPFV